MFCIPIAANHDGACLWAQPFNGSCYERAPVNVDQALVNTPHARAPAASENQSGDIGAVLPEFSALHAGYVTTRQGSV